MTPDTETLKQSIRAMILESLPSGARANPVIFGPGGSLDSLGLVSFLADLEYRLSEETGREIILASDQAMSRSRSPFHDSSSLEDYVIDLLGR